MNGARPHFEAHRSVTETFPTASFTCICLRSAGTSECDSGMSSHEKGPAWHSLPILCFLFFVFFFFFFDNSFIYLLLAGLGLHHFPWTFSRCSRQGLLSRCGVEASHMVASNCGTRALGHAGCSSCSPQARSLQHMGLVTLRHVGSSQTRDRTHVPCNGRPILNHWATREALSNSYP